ncbi:hypothetical protein SAMN02982929_06200 [Saccharopolyspora kobensis]|uniref:Uncharacterized protein n=1 Tax=Saccharopolyspora kobensis TaxID=146035 RepID=A0A1H6EF35_9PSEU|nr:hypothetical protein [Saccharopolyspora kobensis]SEG95464.1 hypothetical protein SAMN02982929_06200 [Saccharopolyspora kobensis]SFD56139.1 hypothetical protein SAMN05216506_10586 [Saccharopolyspora kobensis]
MFWIQLSTFVLFNVLLVALIATQVPFGGLRFATGQHAGTGDGEYTVWHLIADVEAERHRDAADAGAHARRRERPPIALDPPAQPENGPELRFPELDPDDQPTGRHHLRT